MPVVSLPSIAEAEVTADGVTPASGNFVRFPDSPFELFQPYPPAGDQPEAIAKLVEGINDGEVYQTLLGVTGSGKTFTMANVIARLGRPAIVFAPNKTLAAQLYSEFREFFPRNAVEYFVSYYDYYQPEAYVPQRDLFIEKDSAINEHIEQMRLSCTKSVLERRDVVIVATVSAIYGIGQPEAYHQMVMTLRVGDQMGQRDVIAQLVRMQYQRNEEDFSRGKFRVRGDTIDVFPAEHSELAIRIELFDDEIETLQLFDPLTGRIKQKIPRFTVYPSEPLRDAARPRAGRGGDHQAGAGGAAQATGGRRQAGRGAAAGATHALRPGDVVRGGPLQGHRELHAPSVGRGTGRSSGHADRLSAQGRGDVPGRVACADRAVRCDVQRGPFAQDHAGRIRLPVAQCAGQPAAEVRGVRSAHAPGRVRVGDAGGQWEKTMPARWSSSWCDRPVWSIRRSRYGRPRTRSTTCCTRSASGSRNRERVLITTLTKRMAEQLTDYLTDNGVKVRYLHSDVDTVERVEILRDLRLGTFDVLVGINLLREGLDIPEVSLVAILDADKEGFLRSERSLIQTIGRAARNLEGRAILYADRVTDSMERAIGETNRRRERQLEYNVAHGITPRSIIKHVRDLIDGVYSEKAGKDELKQLEAAAEVEALSEKDLGKRIKQLEKQMLEHAKNLEFEKAARVRDQLALLREQAFGSAAHDNLSVLLPGSGGRAA
jgi:excinuclease ABC subunit B